MHARDKKLDEIISWAKGNSDVRAVLLTSSLANPLAPVDDFSDLDIELIFEDNGTYISDNSWLQVFGKPISMIEEGEDFFENRHAMKMVLYADSVKVDFKLYSRDKFLEDIKGETLPEDWDIGYKVLVDKDGITKQMKPPTYQTSIIKKPTTARFAQLLNDFWWDTTYVAKCLAREDLFYAKFMSENNIRTDYMVPLIEWYIAGKNNWEVTTNKHGRLFKKYLHPALWERIEKTFSGSGMEENWEALFALCDLVHELGTELSERLGYPYPNALERDIRVYLKGVRAINKNVNL